MKNMLLVLLCVFSLIPVYAGEDKDTTEARHYYRIKPDIITVLTPDQRDEAPKTIMLRVDLLTNSSKNLSDLKAHQPLYMDKVILFINKHKPSDLNSLAKRKRFKWGIKNTINQALFKETGEAPVKKVLFNRVLID